MGKDWGFVEPKKPQYLGMADPNLQDWGFVEPEKPYSGSPDKYHANQKSSVQPANNANLSDTLGYRMAQWGVDKNSGGNWLNDKVVGIVNAGAGIAKTLADLVSPGGTISRNIDGFIQGGKDIMSADRQASDALYAYDLQQAKDAGGSGVGVMLSHYLRNPSILAEDTVGNALPFIATGGATGLAGAGARTTQVALGTLGAASGAGTVRGNIYDNTQAMDDVYLQGVNPEYRALRQSQSEIQAKRQIGTKILPNLPMIAAGAASGFATGATGLGGVIAGKGGSPFRAGIAEFVGETVDEGGQQFLGNVGTKVTVDPNYKLSDGVAINAAQGALIGAPGGVGAGIGTHLNNRSIGLRQPNTAQPSSQQVPQPAMQQPRKTVNLSQAIAQAGQVANHIQPSPAHPAIRAGVNGWSNNVSPTLAGNIKQSAQRHGVNPNLMTVMTWVESKGDANAVSPTGAKGIGQFTTGTGKQYGLIKDGQDLRANEALNVDAMARLARDNARALGTSEPYLLYMAHQQGAGGVREIMQAAREGRDVSPKVRENMDANGGKGKTPAQFLEMWKQKWAQAEQKVLGGASSSVAINEQPSGVNHMPIDDNSAQLQAMQDAQEALEAQTKSMREAQDHMEYAAYQQEKQSKALRGSDTEVEVNGKYEPSEWQIQEADDLGATMDKADNQFRDRSRLASEQQIENIANNLDHRKLTDSPMMDYGAPTLAQDERTVIGGNGRIAAIKRAYANGKADQYRTHLVENAGRYGFTPEQVQQFQNPVLVRRFKNAVDVQQAAIASNEGGGLTMSALEQSKVDASRLPPLSLFHLGDDGNLNTPANREAIRAFVGAFPKNHQASLLDANGMLSQQGLSRLKNAMLYQAYGDSPTLSRLVESNDIESRNVGNAMMQAAGTVADARGDMAQGDLHDLDISQDIMQAADILEQIKAEGGTIRAYLAQRNMFDEHMTPVSRRVLRFLDKNIRSAKKIRDLINAYYDAVRAVGSPKQADMLGGDVIPTREQLLEKVINDAESGQTHEPNLFEPEPNREATAGHERSAGASVDESGQKSEAGAGDGRSVEQDGEQRQSIKDGLQFSRKAQPVDVAENSFDKTAAQYGGHSAYEQAKSKGETELNYRQWVQVRTPEFKAWFGDWENDPENASKVINPKTGEPLVVYHGTNADFSKFDKEYQRTGQYGGEGFFFTANPETSGLFGDAIMPVFLRAKTGLLEKRRARTEGREVSVDHIRPQNDQRDIWVVFDPEQIKSATGNSGAFDSGNDDIRFSRSAETQKTSVRSVQKAIHDLLMFKANESVEQQLPNVRVVQSDPSVGSDVQAMYNHKTKQITLIADNIPAGQELSVFLHEVFHKRGSELMGERYAQLKGLIEQWANHSEGSIERQVYDAAKRRADESGETGQRYDDELIAYSIEEAVNRGIEPKRGDLERTGVRGFVARAMQLFNQVLSKVVGKPISLTPRDLVTAAHAAAKLEAKKTGKAASTMDSEPQLSKRAKGFESVPETSIQHEEKVYRNALGLRTNQAGELLAGANAYDKAAEVISRKLPWLTNNAPKAYKAMWKDFLAENTKTQKAAKEIHDQGKPIEQFERELLSDILENEVAAGVNPPDELVTIAQDMRRLLSQQTDDLVALGMLNTESAERWRDTYLPRFYKKQADLFGGHIKPMFASYRAARKMGLDGSHMKGRGIFKSVPKGSESQYEALGWEVRGQDKNGQPVVWRDYSKDERRDMGEMRDGIARFTAGYLQTQGDIAKARLYNRIAMNEELASKTHKEGWKPVSDAKIADTGLNRYGALNGMYVHPDVFDHLNSQLSLTERNALFNLYRRALGYWKTTKTVYNPVAHFNNMVSNVHMLWLAGGNPLTLIRGARDMLNKRGYYQEAIDAGLIGEGVDSAAIKDMFGGLQNYSERGEVMTFLAKKVVESHVGKPIAKLGEFAQKAYRVEDEVFKLALYTQQRDRGLSVSEAREYAERFFFDYSDVGKAVRFARDSSLLPFASYPAKAAPAIARAALTRPHRLLGLTAAYWGFNALSYALSGGDEEEERKNMPEYRKGYSIFGIPKQLRLPWNDNGKPAYIDITRVLPLGDFADINNQQGGAPIPSWLMPNGPLIGAASVFLFNRDPFTGEDFKKSYEGMSDKAGEYAKWLMAQWLPSSIGVPFSYHTNKLMDGLKSQFEGTAFSDALEYMGYTGRRRNGDPVQLGDSVRGAFGIKTWSFDPEAEAGKSIRYKQYEAREIRTDMRKTMRDQSLTPAQKQDKLEEQRKALSRLFPAQSVE